MKPLRKGCTGKDVMALQKLLNKAGFGCGTPDGIFGPDTHEAVRALQGVYDLDKTGVVDEATQLALLLRASTPE